MIDPRPSPEPLWVGFMKEVRVEFISTNLCTYRVATNIRTTNLLFFVATEQKGTSGIQITLSKGR